MRAVVTAGGVVDGAFARAIGTTVKALAPFGAGTLLDVALDACEAAGISDVAVVGGRDVRDALASRGVRLIDAAADGETNVLRALDAWPGDRFVYLTSDMPFATGSALRDFVERSQSYEVTMALADVDAYEARFPGAPDHSATLGGERVANGNAFVVGAAGASAVRAFATKFFAARKSLLRMALLLGPAMCLRFALKRLSIADLEAHAGARLGVAVRGVRACDPGLCYDVDTLEEYAYARGRPG